MEKKYHDDAVSYWLILLLKILFLENCSSFLIRFFSGKELNVL